MPSVRPFDPTDLKKGYIADTGLRGRGGRKLFDTEAEARDIFFWFIYFIFHRIKFIVNNFI